MSSDDSTRAKSPMNQQDMFQQDIEIVDQMTKWKKKLQNGERLSIKTTDKGMAPTIIENDNIEIQTIQAINLKSGNIILYIQGNNFLIRRIVELSISDDQKFIVKGDNLEKVEPPVHYSQIIGKVTSLERNGETIELEKKFASSTLGKLKKIGESQLGGPSIDYSKQLGFFKTLTSKLISLIELAYSKLCEGMDKIIAIIFKRTR